MILADLDAVTMSRPERDLFRDLSFTVSTGERWGVVGMNGSGKSTLLRVMAGTEIPEAGAVRHGRGTRIGMLLQDPALEPGLVREVLPPGWEAEAVLTRLGSGDLLDRPTTELSGGQAKRVALAALLCSEHDLLILDEPTNHLDLEAVETLEEWLVGFGGGLVVVTHDRHLLDRVTTRVLELERGVGYVHVPTGEDHGSGYAAYLRRRDERTSQAETAEQVRRNLARKELAWLRRGAPARSTKPKARVAAARAVVDVQAEHSIRDQGLDLNMGHRRLGTKVLELGGAGFSWPDGTRVLDPLDRILEPGDRIALVGPNGAGKSTLLHLLGGRLAPTEGRVVQGTTVVTALHDQTGRDLPTDLRVRDVIAGVGVAPSPEDVRLMERFWFDGDAQFARIHTLSGGERRRLQLLLTLAQRPNVLLLDEPTNDLDLDTLRALEDFLDSWPGVLVVASHDRTFLDRTVEEVWALDGQGAVREMRGGVAGWLADRAAGRGAGQGRPSVPAATRSATRPAGKRRTTSTVARLLAVAQRALDAAVVERDAVLAEMTVATDHIEIERISHRLADAERAVSGAEEEWLALASEAEEIGAGR